MDLYKDVDLTNCRLCKSHLVKTTVSGNLICPNNRAKIGIVAYFEYVITVGGESELRTIEFAHNNRVVIYNFVYYSGGVYNVYMFDSMMKSYKTDVKLDIPNSYSELEVVIKRLETFKILE